MSHVQVVTVEPTKLARVLRLTGAVAYNAFNTTPVITQVGGPVSRILVVPGERVKQGQPLLEVSSPDYSLLLRVVFESARYVSSGGQELRARAGSLRSTTPSPSAICCKRNPIAIQAQADLNASLLGLKILGIPKPEDLEKAPSSAEIPLLAPIGGEVVERDVAPGQAAAGRHDAGVHHFGHEHGVGAREYLSERPGGRESRRRRDGADRFVPR